jgi:CDP-paratose 2-epimerase
MAYLVTGGCGFVGSNLAAELLRDRQEVIVLDNLSRSGGPSNLQWLRTQGEFEFIHADVRNSHDLDLVLERGHVECVFHLAGQVSMTNSLASPRRDFDINVMGSVNLLEGIRRYSPKATIVYASSNKVYGELDGVRLKELATRYQPEGANPGISESARLDFRTPYGCSKGAADQYMLEYARAYGLRTVVFRHSTIYGGRQTSTFDQGWVGWFCKQAAATLNDASHCFTINGDGKQVRDLLYVADAVRCYRAAHSKIADAAGQAFNIGGGTENSMSLLELFTHLQDKLHIQMNYEQLPWRNNDQRYFVADNTKAGRVLGWQPEVSKERGIEATLQWEQSQAATA